MNYFRGFSLTAVSTGLVYALGFLNHALLAHYLSDEDYGELAFWIATVMFGALLFGEWLNRGSVYVVGRAQVRNEVIGNTLVYGLVLGFPVVVAVLLRQWGGESISGIIPISWLLVAGLIVLNTAQKAGLGILLGGDRIKLYALVPLIFICAYAGGNLLLLLTGDLELGRVLWVWLLAMGASACVVFVSFFLDSFRFKGIDAAVFKRTMEVGGRGAISFILIFLLFRSNIWLIDHFMGKGELATFRVAINFADMMQRLPNVAGVVLLAKVVRGQDEEGGLSLSVAQGVLIFSLAAGLGLLLFGRFFIDIFFPKFPGAYIPLVWMLPGLVFAGFGSVFNTRLAGQGYPAITLWAPGAALCLNVGLNLWLIPSMGLRGAALTTSVSFTLWGLLVASYYLRRDGQGWGGFLRLRALTRTIGRRLED